MSGYKVADGGTHRINDPEGRMCLVGATAKDAQAAVRALNAFPALVAALAEAEEALANEGYEDGGPTYALTQIRAALKAAKEGS